MIGFLLGVGLTFAFFSFYRGGGQEGQAAAGRLPACTCSILLFEVKPGDFEGELIDQGTGNLGFSHSALDCCEHDELGRPLIIEAAPKLGVVRSPLAKYAGRKRVRISLGPHEGAELYGCVRAKVGRPFDAFAGYVRQAMGGGLEGAVVCSQLIAECLPERLRRTIVPGFAGVSPNDLARAFGAYPGGPPVLLAAPGPLR